VVELARRQDVAVGQVVIHALQAGGAGIADPACLDRGRLAGEYRQAVVRRVAGQIDQDVDAVLADALRQGVVVQTHHVGPLRHIALEALADGIEDDVVVIGVQRHAGAAGQALEDRFDEGSHGMVAQVARDEADAQHALRVALVGVRLPLLAQRLFDTFGIAQVLGEQLFGVDVLHLAHREQHVAVHARVVRLELEHAAVGVDGAGHAALAHQGNADGVPGQRILRIDRDRGARAGFGFGQAVHVEQGDGQVVVRVGPLRIQFQGALQADDRLLVAARLLQQQAEVAIGLGVLVIAFRGPGHGLDRRLDVAAHVVDHAQRLPAEGIARAIDGQQMGHVLGLVEAALLHQAAEGLDLLARGRAVLGARQALGQGVECVTAQAMAAAQVDGFACGRQLDAVEQDFDVSEPVRGFARIRLDRAGQVGSRFRQAPGLPFQQAQLVLRLGMAWMHVEDGAAQRGGLVELAGVDVLKGELHGLIGNALDLFVKRYSRGV